MHTYTHLLWIMYDLGFPIDAIGALENIYEDAITRIRLPSGGPMEALWRDYTL